MDNLKDEFWWASLRNDPNNISWVVKNPKPAKNNPEIYLGSWFIWKDPGKKFWRLEGGFNKKSMIKKIELHELIALRLKGEIDEQTISLFSF